VIRRASRLVRDSAPGPAPRRAAPAFATLIERFHEITGVPVVLNTSFNDREPIVETPAHALATFQACDLDAACIGGFLVERA
jgi:carbamoyltransferase